VTLRGLLRRFDVLCADAARLPLRTASVDLVFSNLMLQWCSDPDAVFSECRRVLKPGGLLTYTTFGPDTLLELRRAWSTVDGLTHVNRFIDMHDLGDAMVRAGFAEPVMDVDRCTLTYADAHALMRDLKAIGAHNVNAGRARGLTGKSRLTRMIAAYEAFRRDGRLPATYEIVYGQAWAAERATAGDSLRDGEVRVEVRVAEQRDDRAADRAERRDDVAEQQPGQCERLPGEQHGDDDADAQPAHAAPHVDGGQVPGRSHRSRRSESMKKSTLTSTTNRIAAYVPGRS